MSKYRINKPIAATYALAAALITGGGGYYYNANIDEWRREAAEQAAEDKIRAAIAAQFPLTYEMTALVPGAPYPAAPEISLGGALLNLGTRPVSMAEAFTEAQTDIASEDLDNSYRSCAILAYLRDAHRVAVNHYDAAPPPGRLSVPIEQHRAIAATQPQKCEP